MGNTEFMINFLFVTCNTGILISIFYAFVSRRNASKKIAAIEIDLFESRREMEKINEKLESLIHRMIACEVRLNERSVIDYLKKSEAILMPSFPIHKINKEIIVKKRGPGRPPKKRIDEETPAYAGET